MHRYPLEPPNSKLKDKIRNVWYPVREWANIMWTYMGPDKESPPPLPKIDILTRNDGELLVYRGDIRNYNYLNWMENFADMAHGFVLHGVVPLVVPEELKPYNDATIKNSMPSRLEHVETAYGMKTVAVWDTGEPQIKFVNTWSIAMPIHWRFSGVNAGLPPDFTDDRREGGGMIRIIDDTHFELFRYTLLRKGNFRGNFVPQNYHRRGLPPDLQGRVQRKEHDTRKYPGWEGVPPMEDLVIQETQGEIADRVSERLGTSDRGVILLRRLWRHAMEDVANGKDPKGVFRQERAGLEVDTFRGHIPTSKLEIGPKNLPSSRDGRGLLRDKDGNLVFAS